MTLLEYLRASNLSLSAFGQRLTPARPAATVQRWAVGKRVPRPSDAAQIIEASGGQVTLPGIYGVPGDSTVVPAAGDSAAGDSREAA